MSYINIETAIAEGLKLNIPRINNFECSTLLVYESESTSANNFIKSFIAHGINNVVDYQLVCHVWDDLSICAPYMPFTQKVVTEEGIIDSFCKVYPTPKTIDENLRELDNLFINRTLEIMLNYTDYKEYNKDIIMGALQEELIIPNFLIMNHCDLKLLTDRRFKKIIEMGPRVGLYPMIFLLEEELEYMGYDALDFVRSISSIYLITNDFCRAYPKARLIQKLKEINS